MTMTNAEFAREDKEFRKACAMVSENPLYVDFKPSRRQASKWRRKMGIAWKMAHREQYKK